MQKTQIIKNHSTQTRFARSYIKVTSVINAPFSLIECKKIDLDIRAHQICNHHIILTNTFMQVCCSRNINVKSVYLRSISVSVHILCYPWRCIGLTLTENVHPAHVGICWRKWRRIILTRHKENQRVINECRKPKL